MPDIIRDADLVANNSWLKTEGTAESSAQRRPVAGSAARNAAPDEEDRLPAGVAAAAIILLSIGLWAVIITAALWLVSVL